MAEIFGVQASLALARPAQLQDELALVGELDALVIVAVRPGIAAIAEAFGSGAITADGALDRDQMRRLVFSDPGAKILLERIVHPLVGQQIALQTAQAQEDGVRCLVLDIPLLVESGHWRKSLDRILVVDCPVATQVERVVRRNGLARSEVERIIEAQSTRQQRLQAADFVIFNAGKSLEEIAGELAWLGAQFGL